LGLTEVGIIAISDTEDLPFPTRLLVGIADFAIQKEENPREWEGLLNLFYGSGNFIEIKELNSNQLVLFRRGLIFAIEKLDHEGTFAGFQAPTISPLFRKILMRLNA
jgi:hypothetical protein